MEALQSSFCRSLESLGSDASTAVDAARSSSAWADYPVAAETILDAGISSSVVDSARTSSGSGADHLSESVPKKSTAVAAAQLSKTGYHFESDVKKSTAVDAAQLFRTDYHSESVAKEGTAVDAAQLFRNCGVVLPPAQHCDAEKSVALLSLRKSMTAQVGDSGDCDAHSDRDTASVCAELASVPILHVPEVESTHNASSELHTPVPNTHNSSARPCIDQLDSYPPASSQPCAGDSDILPLTSCQHCLLPFQVWRPWYGNVIATGLCTVCSINQLI